MSSSALKKAFVVGWTGATGMELTRELGLAGSEGGGGGGLFPDGVVLMGRRTHAFPQDDPRTKLTQEVVNFDALEESKALFEGCQVGYCCLGTTKAQSGTEGFIKIDRDYVIAAAKLAKEAGCTQFHLMSSAGANKNSWLLYPRTKGEVEAALAQLGFPNLVIYRPAMIRRGGEHTKTRTDEKIFGVLMKPVALVNPRLGQITANQIARGMVVKTQNVEAEKSIDILNNSDIHNLSAQYEK